MEGSQEGAKGSREQQLKNSISPPMVFLIHGEKSPNKLKENIQDSLNSFQSSAMCSMSEPGHGRKSRQMQGPRALDGHWGKTTMPSPFPANPGKERPSRNLLETSGAKGDPRVVEGLLCKNDSRKTLFLLVLCTGTRRQSLARAFG